NIHAHARKSLPVFVITGAGRHGDVFKGAVAFVVIERLAHAVVGDEDIRPAIVVKIGKGDAEGLAIRVSDSRLDADVVESAVWFLMIKNIRRPFEIFRMTIRTRSSAIAAEDRALFKVPVEIPRDEQIQSSIAIVINPSRAG